MLYKAGGLFESLMQMLSRLVTRNWICILSSFQLTMKGDVEAARHQQP